MRRVVIGAAVLGTYLLVALSGTHIRPLFDGLAPATPYRYVDPPPDLADVNETPEGVTSDLQFTGEGGTQVGGSVTTPDGQAQVAFQSGTFAPKEGQTAVTITVTPRDPARYNAPREPILVQGNVYEISAKYAPSGDAVTLDLDATVILRYPAHAEGIARYTNDRWRNIKSLASPASLQFYAETGEFGVFATLGPPPVSRWWVPYIAAGGGVIAGVVGYWTGRKRMRNRTSTKKKPRRRKSR